MDYPAQRLGVKVKKRVPIGIAENKKGKEKRPFSARSVNRTCLRGPG